MPEEKIDFAKLDIDTNALEGKQARLIQQITELREAQRDLKKETDNLSKATDEQAKTYVNQDATLKKLNTEYNQQKAILAEVQNGTKGLTDALTKQNKTEKEAADNNKELIKIRKQLDKTTKEGQKATEEINKKIDENNQFLKENSSQLEQQRLNIGNYASALDKVVPGLGRFVQGLNATRLAMLAIPIIALVSGIASLVQAFASTQRGMDEINKVLRPAQVLFEKLIGFIQDIALSTFDKLKEAVNNPKEALRELADVVIENLVNRFKSVLVLGEAIGKLFEGDFSGAAKTAADAFIQLTTGIEDGTNKLSKAGEAISQFVEEGVAQGEELDRIIKQLEQREIDLTVPLAKARNELKAFKQQAEDVSKTETERLAALEKAVKLQGFITESEQELQDLAIQRKELENTFNDTSREDELALQELIAQRYELETAGIENLTTLQNLRNTIQNQLLAKQEQEIMNNNTAIEQAQADLLAELDMIIEKADTEISIEQAVTDAKKKEHAERIKAQIEEAHANIDALRGTANAAMEIFGSTSRVGKAAAVFEIQLSNAQALAKGIVAAQSVPFPGNLLAIATTIATITSNFRRIKQLTRSAKEPTVQKFAKGGLMEIGGKRHHSGGTKFYGEDGTQFEAEKGEMIGVLNRNASKLFMDFNNNGLSSFYGSMILNGIQSSPQMSDKGIIGAVRENTSVLRRKPIAYPHIDKNGIYTIVDDGQNIKKLDHDYYHG